MAPLQGYLGAFYLASDVATAVNSEAVGTGTGALTAFALDNVNVELDGLAVRVAGVAKAEGTDFDITPNGGITFRTAPVSDAAVSADYSYYAALEAAGGFYSWSMDVSADELDGTDFSSTGWRKKVAGLRTFSVTAEQYWVSTPQLFDQLGDRLIVRCYTDEANSDYYTGWAYLTGVSPKAGVDTIVDQTIKLAGTGVPARVG